MTTATAERSAPRRTRRGRTTYKLLVLPGDGIGPEVVAEGLRVLRAVGERFDRHFEVNEHVLGGACIDRYGVALRPETLAAARKSHALLLGAVGGLRWDDPSASVRPVQAVLG